MQAADTQMPPGLGLVLDRERFSDPKLNLSPEKETRIAQALTQVLHAAGQAEAPPRKMAHIRDAMVAKAALILMKSGHLAEVAHLTAAAGSAPHLVRLQVRALQRLRAQEPLAALIEVSLAQSDLPEDMRDELFTLRSRYRMNLGTADHAAFLPSIPASLTEAFESLWDGKPRASEVMVTTLHELRGKPGETPTDLRRRLDWGLAVKEYLIFLGNLSADLRRRLKVGEALDRSERRLLRLARELDDLFVPPDLSPLHRIAGAGRSVLLVQAHAGPNPSNRLIAAQLGLPTAVVGGKIKTNLEPGGNLRVGAHGDFQTDFLKLVKLVRKSPHVIRMLPDGGNGGDFLPFDLMGRQVRLGQGAAVLGWYARAAVFFPTATWRDGRIHMGLRTGPVADPEAGREAFDQAFYDFYLDRCRDLVLGAPEDMCAGGGFWAQLVPGGGSRRGT